MNGKATIDLVLMKYINSVHASRSPHTARTYANSVKAFRTVLKKNGIDVATALTSDLSEDPITWFIKYLKDLSPATERLYLQATVGFYEYVAAEELAQINLPRLRQIVRQRARRSRIRLPQFAADDIEKLLNSVEDPLFLQVLDEQERLRALRGRAFLLTLADTGLRVHEACELRRGDVDFDEGQAVVIGKADQQAIVRFSNRSITALSDYLGARAELDGNSGKPLASLPLFARHDRGAGKKVKSMTTETGRNIVHERVAQTLGEGSSGRITPHSLRHYFVTTVLRASGNLKTAQELARHSSILVTQRYANLSSDVLDREYHNIFNKPEPNKDEQGC